MGGRRYSVVIVSDDDLQSLLHLAGDVGGHTGAGSLVLCPHGVGATQTIPNPLCVISIVGVLWMVREAVDSTLPSLFSV